MATEGLKLSELDDIGVALAGTDQIYVIRGSSRYRSPMSRARITATQISNGSALGIAILTAVDVAAVFAALGIGALAELDTVGTGEIDDEAVGVDQMADLLQNSLLIGDGTNRPIAFPTGTVGRNLVGAETAPTALGVLRNGPIFLSASAVGNVGAGEDDLLSISLAAALLSVDGDSIELRAAGSFAATANNKRLRMKFGGTTILDTGTLTITAASDWVLTAQILRTGAATQIVNATLLTSDPTAPVFAAVTSPTETLSGAVTLKLTGEATADDDIRAKMWKGVRSPAP